MEFPPGFSPSASRIQTKQIVKSTSVIEPVCSQADDLRIDCLHKVLERLAVAVKALEACYKVWRI